MAEEKKPEHTPDSNSANIKISSLFVMPTILSRRTRLRQRILEGRSSERLNL